MGAETTKRRIYKAFLSYVNKMNKKILLSVSLVLLVGLAVFVSATMSIKTANEKKYAISVTLTQGWNLISGIYPPQQISQESEIKREDIKSVYFYSPAKKDYLQIYPNLDTSFRNDYSDDYVFSHSMWVYSDKAGILNYDSIVYSNYPTISTTQLVSGWNFLTIIPEFEGKSLTHIKGTCNIEKAYLWDASQQQWGSINNLLDDNNILKNEGKIGGGFVIKVSNDCTLSSSGSNIAPPTVPN